METVYCPKCREAKHIVECRHLASDAWQCPRCDFEFQLDIMPDPAMDMPEIALTDGFSSGILD